MVGRLIQNVVGDTIEVRMGNGKCVVAFLPGKMTPDLSPLVDMIRRSRLDVPDQIRRSDVWFQTKEKMGVV